jgi:hypothetical protein
MHCHPKKTTGLVVLDGEVEVSFLADKRRLQSLDKVMIRRGLFHSTKALSEQGALVFEIETPVDKQDLVRLNDQYGRVAKPYEDATFEELKDENCLWIQEPRLGEKVAYQFADCTLLIENTSTIETINSKQDTDLLMFLSGGMVRIIDGVSHCVTIPGDVGFASVVKQVSVQLDGVLPQTILMTITKNNNK